MPALIETNCSAAVACKDCNINVTFESSHCCYNQKWAEMHDDNHDVVGALGSSAPKFVAATLADIKGCSSEQRTQLKILDVGCGTGLLGEQLRAHGFAHVDGLDASPAVLEKARNRGVYDRLIGAVVEAGHPVSGVKPASYDMVVCSTSLAQAHIKPAAMRELVKLLKPNTGLLAICYQPVAVVEADRSWLEEMCRAQREMVQDDIVEWIRKNIFKRYINRYNEWRGGRLVVYRRKQ